MAAKSIALKIDADTRDRVERLAERRRSTTQGVMREAFRQDALDAWTEHQNTGLHANASEVKTWLETWGDGNELSPPNATGKIRSCRDTRPPTST